MSDALLISKFRCPSCQADLVKARAALTCRTCDAGVALVDGIADFVGGRFDTTLAADVYDQEHGIEDAHSDVLYQRIRAIAGSRWPSDLGSVVEIGCGTGYYSRGLLAANEARDVVLTDVSVNMLRFCRRNLENDGLLGARPVAFAAYSSHETCMRDAVFDTCLGTSVVHHIPDVRAFLADVFRCLRPGGRAFFTEPNLRFYQALARGLADIVAILLREYKDHPDPLQPLLNWLSTQRVGTLFQDDMEFLSTLEDKHQFTAERIAFLGAEIGFTTSETVPWGDDPTGAVTFHALAREIGLDEGLTDRVARMLPGIGARYTSLLGRADTAPSMLIWLTKTKDRSAPNASPPRPGADAPAPDPTGLSTRCHLTVTATARDGAVVLRVLGWCVSDLDIKWVRARAQGRDRDAPVMLPRPDVQRLVNHDGRYAVWNALCSGVDAELSFPGEKRGDGSWSGSLHLVFAGGAVVDIPVPPSIPFDQTVSLSL